jgi:hypothetical protein
MHKAGPSKPFRFIYLSGVSATRDPTQKPLLFGSYSVMRVGNLAFILPWRWMLTILCS